MVTIEQAYVGTTFRKERKHLKTNPKKTIKVYFKVVTIEQAYVGTNFHACVNTLVAKVSTLKFPTSIKSIFFTESY